MQILNRLVQANRRAADRMSAARDPHADEILRLRSLLQPIIDHYLAARDGLKLLPPAAPLAQRQVAQAELYDAWRAYEYQQELLTAAGSCFARAQAWCADRQRAANELVRLLRDLQRTDGRGARADAAEESQCLLEADGLITAIDSEDPVADYVAPA